MIPALILPAEPALVAAPLILGLAFLLHGLAGFGSATVAIPLLVQILPLEQIVCFFVIIDLAANLILGSRAGGIVEAAEVRRIVPFQILGALLGFTLLVGLPREVSLLTLGLLVTAYALWRILDGGGQDLIHPRWGPVAGLAGGALGALFGTGGPAFVMYLSRRLPDKGVLRATLARIISLNIGLRVLIFGVTGLLWDARVFGLLALCTPPAAVGLWLGSRLHARISDRSVIRIITLILLGSGVSLLIRNWPG